jgi:large subunit ribosomal protein L29
MKISEMRDKGENDLLQRERELNEQLFKLRFQRSTGAMENPSKMRQVRREIARIKTLLREKKGSAVKSAAAK